MKINPQQLMDDGYIIIENCIPPNQFDELRRSFEVLVERQKAIWARERKPHDPPGGHWETGAQPRVSFSPIIDDETANAVEFCLHENTLGVSCQAMGAPESMLKYITLMCSPVRDHGPAGWHRDIEPYRDGPLCGLQADMAANGVGTVQWNIALYDDDVFWLVPASHRRPNTDAESRQLLSNSRVPLPNSIPLKLRAGDGAVYSNALLHWGSNYSTKLRRTIHLAYRAFGSDLFSYRPYINWNMDFTRHLSPWARETFERFTKRFTAEFDVIAQTFRAVVDKDEEAFREGLATLHPGEKERMVCVMLLTKLAYKVHRLNHPDVAVLPPPAQAGAIAWPFDSLEVLKGVASRFTRSETDTLWRRFAVMDDRLKSDTDQYVPGFQTGPTKYIFHEMPANFEVEDFIASWDK
ncbi:MAG: phytanoyl-CoA dioxygenase family protein [Candidatus Poribacteria bacterium]|nr:phytanoyl-CoA dioxygenase family protein [Candidatus Poribacteria bacterium]